MFTTFRRFRRQIAVTGGARRCWPVCWSRRLLLLLIRKRITGLLSMPVAMRLDAGFSDVPSMHANAGDIDCIAYYGITKGTSATTFSPLQVGDS